MKYKFIGTEQDLIDNGYSIVLDINMDIYAIKRTNEGNSYISWKKYVKSFHKHMIKDLIDKGLVVII